MMKLGTGIGFSIHFDMSIDERCRILAEVGFDSLDICVEDSYKASVWTLPDHELRSEMEKLRKTVHKHGLIIGQTHAPLDCFWSPNAEVREACWKAQVQAIKACAFLGSPYAVVHPLTSAHRVDKKMYEEAKQINMEYLRFMEPYLKEYNVKAAIENMFTYDAYGRPCKSVCSTAASLKDYIDTLDSDRFVACLDVGHAALALQDPVEMIYSLGKDYLHVTHMHDNNLLSDDHMIPGYGKLDWVSIGKALNDIGYDGVFNYEANRTHSKLGPMNKDFYKEFLQVYVELGRAIIESNS